MVKFTYLIFHFVRDCMFYTERITQKFLSIRDSPRRICQRMEMIDGNGVQILRIKVGAYFGWIVLLLHQSFQLVSRNFKL